MNNEFLFKNMYLNRQINFNYEYNKVDILKYSDISYKDLLTIKLKKIFEIFFRYCPAY